MSAKATTKWILGAVRWMVDAKGALSTALAWLWFCTACNSMAWLTEMGGAEAEPEGDRAAETTFELYGFLSVGLAFVNTDSRFLRDASTTH